MTASVEDQNCGNCYFVRARPVMVDTPGIAGGRQTGTALQCRYNPPPWETVHATAWCACWSDSPRTP